MKKEKLVEIKGLKTYFKVEGQTAKAVDGLDFDIYRGEVLGIVGESGSGKSVTSLSLIQLIPNPPGEVTDGEIIFKGQKIFDGQELNAIKDLPDYHFWGNLSENTRVFLTGFIPFCWLIILSLLPLASSAFSILSFIAVAAGAGYTLFSSPRRKGLREFRDKMLKTIRNIRGREIAMIFQEPMTSLNPVFTVGMQIIEALETKSILDFLKDWVLHTWQNIRGISWQIKLRVCLFAGTFILFFSQLIAGWSFNPGSMIVAFFGGFFLPVAVSVVIMGLQTLISNEYRKQTQELFARGVKLLDSVGIPDAESRMLDYPHQFSGGMRQRAMIAMALAKNPSLLIADEPTTALDVTIQAQILELMTRVKNLREEAAIILITHNLAVVAESCERVMVMYGGKIQEVAEVKELFAKPLHPYTFGLLHSIPRPVEREQGQKERLQAIRGMVPNILDFPPGCKFCTRCDRKLEICDTIEPELIELTPGHSVRCHLYQDNSSSEQPL